MDTEVNVKNNKLYTNTYRKKHDRQNFLHINSEHTKSLKNSIPYSQPLRIKQICTKLKDFEHHSNNDFLNRVQLRATGQAH